RHQTKASTSACVVALVVARAAAATAADGGCRNHREPVLLVRISVHSFHAHGVARARNQLLQLHDSSFARPTQEHAPTRVIRHQRSRGSTRSLPTCAPT